MMWTERYHDQEFSILACERKRGGKYPDWFLNEPAPSHNEHLFLDGFGFLSTCRRVESGPIPWDAIQEYCDRTGIVGDSAKLYTEVIMRLDSALLKHHQEKREKDRGSRNGNRSVHNKRSNRS